MNIGFTSIYPYRGSIHNMVFLSKIFEKEDHKAFFITCDAAVPYCYNRLIKGNSKLIECPKCILGGVRSFNVNNIERINANNKVTLEEKKAKRIVDSASFSLHRIETDEDCLSQEVIETQKKLYRSAEIVYKNAIDWIKRNKLDMVILFNGRLDLLRAVLVACEDCGVPYITFEASYPQGVILKVNEDCRALRSMNKMVKEFASKPLNKSQIEFALNIAQKMLKKQNMVWRLYNVDYEKAKWPIENSNKKVLIVPSSNHEFKGLEDLTSNWSNSLEAFDEIIKHCNISYDQCVIRFHPNWSEKIGVNKTGYKSERVYKKWAEEQGIHIVPSLSKLNTNDLLRDTNLLIVQGGTAGIEGGLLGKKVIGVNPSPYTYGDFSVQVHGKDELYKLDELDKQEEKEIIRKTLRFLYTYHARFPQYIHHIKAKNVFENKYYSYATIEPIVEAIRNGYIQPSDAEFEETLEVENEYIEMFYNETNSKCQHLSELKKNEILIERKNGFKWIDKIRSKYKSGDR